jgi:dihydrofolate reductase
MKNARSAAAGGVGVSLFWNRTIIGVNQDGREAFMGKVVLDITMSLDGFVTAPNDGPGQGLGEGGQVLHEWVFDGKTERDTEVLDEAIRTTGSAVLGRRTFDIAEDAWGDNPPFSGPVFVLTHRAREGVTRGEATFTFVTDGLESALEQARAAAGDKVVRLMGANISQQYLRAGLVDEIELHVANVLLGEGRPLFANTGARQIRLERTRVIATPTVTHLTYRVLK